MKKIIRSIKQKPINLILIVIVLFLYTLNNLFLKKYTQGIIQLFLRCYFNDLICPLFFISYSNLMLISVNKEIKELKHIMLFGFSSGMIWEFVSPIINSRSVTDKLDLLFYIIGAFLYWCSVKAFSKEK